MVESGLRFKQAGIRRKFSINPLEESLHRFLEENCVNYVLEQTNIRKTLVLAAKVFRQKNIHGLVVGLQMVLPKFCKTPPI